MDPSRKAAATTIGIRSGHKHPSPLAFTLTRSLCKIPAPWVLPLPHTGTNASRSSSSSAGHSPRCAAFGRFPGRARLAPGYAFTTQSYTHSMLYFDQTVSLSHKVSPSSRHDTAFPTAPSMVPPFPPRGVTPPFPPP